MRKNSIRAGGRELLAFAYLALLLIPIGLEWEAWPLTQNSLYSQPIPYSQAIVLEAAFPAAATGKMSHLFLARPISALLRGIELSGEEGTARLREILNRYPDPALRAFRGQEIELIAHSFTRANDGEFTPVRTILWRGRL